MAVAKRPGHGGARPGAGRKRSLQDPRQIAIDLERLDLEALTEIAKAVVNQEAEGAAAA